MAWRKLTTVVSAAILLLGSGLARRVSAKEVKHEQRRISLRLKEADVSKVLPQLAGMMDARLDLQCNRKARITIDFSNLTVPTALSAICESANLKCTLITSRGRALRVTCAPEVTAAEGGKQLLSVKVKKEVQEGEGGKTTTNVTLNLRNAKVLDVMKLAARLTHARLLLDTSLAGKTITCQVEDKPLKVMLDMICAQIGAQWRLEPGNPPVLKVSPK